MICFCVFADDIVERYDNVSKSVSDRNEKLQITLTRSMSVQDGLDEMMGWMEGVEANVQEKGQIPLDSASIGDILSKEAVRVLVIIPVLQQYAVTVLLTLSIYYNSAVVHYVFQGPGAGHRKSPEQHLSHEIQGEEVCGDGRSVCGRAPAVYDGYSLSAFL